MANFRASLNFRQELNDEDVPLSAALYNGFLFQRNRDQEHSHNLMAAYAQYPYYASNQAVPLQYVPQVASRSCSPTSISQAESHEKSDRSKHSSWENVEVQSLITAYRGNYDHLKSTKCSHGKKSVWEGIMEDFLSLCSDAGVDSAKTLAQIKEKWRSFDKYKAIKDNNNKTGRDPKTFEFYDEIDDFLSGSAKVSPRFVKETKVQSKEKDSPPDPDCENSLQESESDLTAALVAEEAANARAKETPNDAKEADCPPKKKRKRSSLDSSEAESTILNLMEAQQAAIKKADEKDERMFQALLRSQNDAQQRHQEFTLSVLSKLGDIFSSKKCDLFSDLFKRQSQL